MNFDLSDEQRLLRDTVRDFARQEVAPVAEELDRTKSFPYEIVEKLGGLGLMGIPFPQEYGGGGADTLSYVLAVEELARIDSSVCITMAAHTSLGTMPIYLWGTDEQKDEWLPVLCSGERLASFGLTEPEAGSDAGNVRTTARAGRRRVDDRRGQAVHHQLRHQDLRLRLDHRCHRRDRRAQGDLQPDRPHRHARLRGGEPYRKMGWNASDTRPLSFEGCRCPGGQPARPPRRRFQELPPHPRRRPHRRRRDGGRPRPGRPRRGDRLRQGAPGIRQADLQVPIDPGEDRRLSAQIEAPACSPGGAALEKDAGKSFTLTAAQAKLITGRLAVRATEEAVQIHGGYGYIEEYPVCRFYRDAKILTIGEGTDEVQQMVIARQLGC
jgi:alkylation response protein AidB-like acyl-CoA dehydrogenase